MPEKKVFEVHVEQGHKHASKIVLRGEAGYSEPGVEPGDVIFVLEQKQHKYLRRINSDLVYEKVRGRYRYLQVLKPLKSARAHQLLDITNAFCHQSKIPFDTSDLASQAKFFPACSNFAQIKSFQ